ncbi:uncharacterized protein C5orf34 homolog [Pholidichthys leucotaenia]
METNAGIILMIMYEDESVDVRYRNGAWLQLSPCGCEFLLVKEKDPRAHPLQPAERVRQRTRFAISSYKELMVGALAFRNKYASRPYLADELISADHKKPFVSSDSGVQWPEQSSCQAEVGPGGSSLVRSKDGRAVLTLSPSGEEFSVDFTCSLSRNQNQFCSMQYFSKDVDGSHEREQQVNSLVCNSTSDQIKAQHQGRESRRKVETRSRSCSPQIISILQTKPEQMYQSTTVVQHHSCCAVAPIWSYPLSLAHGHWAARFSQPKDGVDVNSSNSINAEREINLSDTSEEKKSFLPQPLPLTCTSPHWHRWTAKDPLAKDEHADLPTEPLKVMWCQGVTYRILSGTVSVIEVSLGDGSVIRSNSILSSYFTHFKPELKSGRLIEVTYHLTSLPPDVLGQDYSVRSVISRANRILVCYNQAKQLQKLPAMPSCLQEVTETLNTDVEAVFKSRNWSDVVAAELEKIQRFNFLLENSHLLRGEEAHSGLEDSCAEIPEKLINETFVAEALQRTATAIQDIDALISAATLT